MARFLALPLLLASLAGSCPGGLRVASALSSRVRVGHGSLVGVRRGAVDAFLGVPYARPPVGQRRFAPPEDWTEEYVGGGMWDATSFGARCPQDDGGGGDSGPAQDEDCLFLNIWVPQEAKSSAAPALVFLYGGSFVSGAGDQYDGTELASATGAVVVTVNYRVGALGFALVDDLPGNFGLLDQQSALRWLARQGHNFGMDASRTLLFGESSGSESVAMHLLLPGSRGLFSSALMESGVAVCVPEAYARSCGRSLVDALGCSGSRTLRCLRQRPWRDVLAAQVALLTPRANGTEFDVRCSFWATVDGHTIPRHPDAMLRAGDFHRVPIAVGVNHDEGGVIAFADWPEPVERLVFESIVSTLMHSRGSMASDQDVAQILAAYPTDAAGDLRPLLAQLLGDYLFICRSRRFLRLHQQAADAPAAFKYVFAQRAQSDPAPEEWGVYHSSELPFVFGPGESGSIMHVPNLTVSEQQLRELVGRLWHSMAARGNPNGASEGREPWQRYDADVDSHLEIRAPTSEMKYGFHRRQCDAWDAVWDRHLASSGGAIVV